VSLQGVRDRLDAGVFGEGLAGFNWFGERARRVKIGERAQVCINSGEDMAEFRDFVRVRGGKHDVIHDGRVAGQAAGLKGVTATEDSR